MAGNAAFAVFVTFAAIDKISRPMMKIGAQMGVLDKQTKALEARLKGFKNMMFVGGGLAVAGGLMAKGLLSAAGAAGQLENNLMRIRQTSKNMTDAQYGDLRMQAMKLGIPTSLSSLQVGDVLNAMKQGGLDQKDVLNHEIQKLYVEFANVQREFKNENPEQVTQAVTEMAHMFKLYKGQEIAPFMQDLNAITNMTSHSLEEMKTTFGYIAPQAKAMGQTARDTLADVLLLTRVGLGTGKAGTNWNQVLMRSYMGMGKKHDAAMRAGGFMKGDHSVFEDDKGAFVGTPQLMAILQDFGKRMGGDKNKMVPILHDIFGVQGMRAALVVADSGDMFEKIKKEIAGFKTIHELSEAAQATYQGQLRQLTSTLADIEQAFGQYLIPVLIRALKIFNRWTGAILEWMLEHPLAMKWIATFTAIGTAALIAAGAILVFVGAIGWLKVSGAFVAGLKLIKVAFMGLLTSPITWWIIGIGAALTLLYIAWTNNWGGMQEKVAHVWGFLKALWVVTSASLMAGFNALSAFLKRFWEGARDDAIFVWTIFRISMTYVWQETKKAAVSIWTSTVGILTKIWDAFADRVMSVINAIKTGFNEISNLPGHFWDAAKSVLANPTGGSAFGSYGSGLSAHAMGTAFAPGGLSLVGEHGPEIVDMPRGSRVTPNDKLGGLSIGELHVHAAQGMSIDDLARAVVKKIEKKWRIDSYSQTDASQPRW